MSWQIFTKQTAAPSTPATNKVKWYINTNKLPAIIDDTGLVSKVLISTDLITKQSTADQVANAADTYLNGSSVLIPPIGLKSGVQIRWLLAMTKTAAGTAQPVFSVRFGTIGTIADTARLTFTGVAQTANADTGIVEVAVTVRFHGAAGNIQGVYRLDHDLGVTGLSNQSQPNIIAALSGNFDTTVANSIIGISCNPGASGVWTFVLVQTQVLNLNP